MRPYSRCLPTKKMLAARAILGEEMRPLGGERSSLNCRYAHVFNMYPGSAPAPTRAATIEPAEVPATSEKLTPHRMAASKAPTCAAPRHPPPSKTPRHA